MSSEVVRGYKYNLAKMVTHNYSKMSTPFPVIIDKIKSERNKDKASTQGFLYTLHRSVNGKEHWVREKHGICKARLQTLNDNIIKPENPSEIQSQHSHGPDIARVEMLKGYNVLKIAARNSERWDHFPFVYGLLKSKNELTYDRMFNKLLELEPELNPSSIMIDFEKAAMNSLEKKFITCVSGCFFPFTTKHLQENSSKWIDNRLSTR